MNYRQACAKRNIEALIVYPLILLGKILGLLFPLKTKSRFFLFFPSDGIGGATKVNADILDILANQKPVVIFSKDYSNHSFAERFIHPDVKIVDLRTIIDNKWLYFINIIYRGILSVWINRSGASVVFGGESIYFYKVIPYLKKSIRKAELLHLDTWLNYNQAFVKYIDLRIASTPNLKREIEKQYVANGIPSSFARQLLFIDNWVDIPEFCEKDTTGDLNILFVGRGAPQKRVPIISQVAETMLQATTGVQFTFVGDVSPLLSPYVLEHCSVYEHIAGKEELSAIYEQADILILTSAFEGLPIVVMDMMVRAKVVLSTAVNGIPDYVRHRDTGLLIFELQDEAKIVQEAIALISEMKNDRAALRAIGYRAYLFASERFGKRNFDESYKQVFGL